MDRKTKINVWYIVAALAGFMLVQGFYQQSKQYTTIPYSRFQTLLDQDKIDQVWIAQNTIEGTLKQPEKDGLKQFVTTRVGSDLASELNKHNVTYTGEIPSTWLTDLLSWVLPAVIFFGLWMFVIRRFGQGAGGLMAIGKSRARIYVETDTKVTFADVAGVEEAKAELKEGLGVLMVVAENDPDAKRFVAALEDQLEVEGWHKGRNLEIAYRWGASNPERLAQYANELVLAAPDVLVTLGTPALVPFKKIKTNPTSSSLARARR